MHNKRRQQRGKIVAPPRGERGLKYYCRRPRNQAMNRSPSWGAWIEITYNLAMMRLPLVAPPRGERGLKYDIPVALENGQQSLPLVGSVD